MIRFARTLAILLALALSLATSALAVVIRVPQDYETISQALAAAPNGAAIEIAPGAYPESLVINRPVSLRPARDDGEVLLAPLADEPVIAIIDTESVTIEGLTIVGGEIGEYAKLVAESREQSIDRMEAEAEALGANAIVCVRFGTSVMAQSAAELLAYGTAVIVEDE
jgi:uncharacterized protein YbjQ (UPF0145 family)